MFFWINYEFELNRYTYEFTIVYSNFYTHIYSVRQKLRLSVNDLSVLISNFISMKKKNLGGKLNLQKSSVSNLDTNLLNGGVISWAGSNHCTHNCSFKGDCGTTGPAPFTVHVASDCACL